MVYVKVQETAKIARIEPYVQPLVRLNGDADGTSRFEVLSRFYDEEGRYIAPNKIFDNKGNRNVFYSLDKQILQTCIRHYENLKAECLKHNFRMGINVSDQSIVRIEDFVDFALQELKESTLSPEQISLEVNEKARDGISEFTEYATLKGFGISVDDLGAQNSTMQKTKFEMIPYVADRSRLTVKIDQSIIRPLLERGHSYPKSDEAFIDMALALKQDTRGIVELVAEGIETQEISDFLQAKGIDYGQGYYYARPMSFEDYCRWLQND